MLAFLIAIVPGVVAFMGVGKLLAMLVGRRQRAVRRIGMAMPGRLWAARKQDHRLVMVGAGLLRFVLSIVMFSDLSMTFQPPLNLDFSAVNIGLPPGTTLKQTEAVADKVARSSARIPTSNACSSACASAPREPQHRAQEGPRRRPAPSSNASLAADSSPRSPTRGSTSRARTAAAPAAAARDIMLYLGGDDPEQADRHRQQDRRGDGDHPRASRAARRRRPGAARNHRSSRASTLPPISASRPPR